MALRGEGRPHDPHNITVVGVYKDSGWSRVSLLPYLRRGEQMSLRVLLADDQALVRLGIRAVFQGLDDITVCGEATNGIDAIRKAYELAPDIIVADPWLSGANGVILTKRILERNPNQKVLIFADLAPDAMIYQLLSAGIKGLVLKTDPSADLIEATKAFGKIVCTFLAQLLQPLSVITCAPICPSVRIHANIPPSDT